ncbi:hypothetical protein V6N12_002634 [Hibiscus sabdariffa]|uniref:Uncharacterized protein n=1 Tax=Hibiscus sabdariffa TaxID=183260 RepID=A0ABR2ED37_9ROSI
MQKEVIKKSNPNKVRLLSAETCTPSRLCVLGLRISFADVLGLGLTCSRSNGVWRNMLIISHSLLYFPCLPRASEHLSLSIKGYTDASFQTDKDDSRSQSGFVFCLNGASEATKEAVWIKKFISELGVVPSISDTIELYCDNNGAIAQAKEPRSHQRSKHILRRFHLIREIIDRGDMEICKVHTDDNIVDPLTKPLAQQKHDCHTKSLGIRFVSDCCFNNLPRQDDKGDVSAETTGPAWAVAWADDQISAERLAVLWLISKSSN